MFGLKPADSGQILKEGTPIKVTCPRDAIEQKIGYVPEDRLSEGLFLTQSIGDNIIISEIDKLK
ncbi:sugar ABC transporter ATP-binding protein, partial [Acinetobacter baumannii]|nr:sugar ABC transporter ATP-binding protein [Acinetobacter baumannii]